jgi:ABC-2 type transport system permease protein
VTRQVRAEILKLRSTRTTFGLALGMVALVLLVSLVAGLTMPLVDLSRPENQRTVLGAGQTATLFAALVGVMAVTTEFRYGTIRSTLLVEPRRTRVLVAKLLAALLAGLVFGIVAEGLAFAIGRAVVHGRGVALALGDGAQLHLGLGTVAVTALWTAIGVGIGAIVRHQVGAIVGLLTWIFVAESLLFGLVPSVGRYAPGPAGRPLAGDSAAHLLSPSAGGAVLAAYAIALAAAGAVLMLRRDVD